MQLLLEVPPIILNYAYLFYMVWKCAGGLGVIPPLIFFINFSTFLTYFFSTNTNTTISTSTNTRYLFQYQLVLE